MRLGLAHATIDMRVASASGSACSLLFAEAVQIPLLTVDPEDFLQAGSIKRLCRGNRRAIRSCRKSASPRGPRTTLTLDPETRRSMSESFRRAQGFVINSTPNFKTCRFVSGAVVQQGERRGEPKNASKTPLMDDKHILGESRQRCGACSWRSGFGALLRIYLVQHVRPCRSGRRFNSPQVYWYLQGVLLIVYSI
jgi:hypothetical protein